MPLWALALLSFQSLVGAQPWSQEEESGAGGGPARPTCLPRWAVGQGALTWEGELAARQAWVQPHPSCLSLSPWAELTRLEAAKGPGRARPVVYKT